MKLHALKKILAYCVLFGMWVVPVHGQVGIGTLTPASSLEVAGGMAVSIRSFSANTSATINDYVLVFTGSAAVAVTLPDATTCNGRIYWIKDAGTGSPAPVVTINTVASQTIDGVSSWTLDETNEVTRMESDGSNWWVNNQDVPVRKTGTFGGAWNQGGNTTKATKNLGTSSNYDLPFVVNDLEAMRLTTAGYLGIGTTNPAGRLHIVTDNDDAGNDYYFNDHGTTTTPGFFLKKGEGTIASPQNLQAGDIISQFRFVPHINGAVSYTDGSGLDAWYQGTGTNNSTDLRLFTSGTEAMHLGENKNVGINTSTFDATNPETMLVNAGNTNSYNVISGKGDIDNYLQLNIQNKSAGASASSDIVATADNGDETVNYIDMGINSSGYSNAAAPILNGTLLAYLYTTANDFAIGNSSAGHDLIFFTGGYNATNERMRITSSGNVGIGVSNPTDMLMIAGIMSPSVDNSYSLGSSSARWSSVWSANGTIQTSDARLKTNIKTLAYGIKEIMQMNPVGYNWKTDSLGKPKIGLIAQEVQELVPEVVTGNVKTTVLGMNYAELVAVLINTIQQQQKELKAVIKELKSLE
jgi:hypothetical protein